MSDGGHDGGVGVGDRAHEAFVGEGEEVLDRSAAARDHDDVHVLHGVQLEQCSAHLGHTVIALDGDLADLEACVWPAIRGVDDHVVFRFRAPTADQSNRARQERQRLLARIREQTLGGQAGTQCLNLGQQVAHALQVNLRRL